jgi:phosphatidylserine/phosphatidylglycerophosphate/cardiolipin synthase-like enzyme
MRNAVAFANNDVATIAWSYGKRPDGCMGFAIYRVDAKNKETALPSHAVFKGDTIQKGQTTDEYPVQKFYWKDVYARLVGEQTNSFAFRYKIVPLEGTPGHLKPMATLPILVTNEVELTSKCSASLSATFNRGLISTQHVSNAMKGKLDVVAFKRRIGDSTDPLRSQLTGQTLGTLLTFLNRAKSSGSIYAALYELTDTELIARLVSVGKKLNIVLASIASKPEGSVDSSKAAQRKIKAQARRKGATKKQKQAAEPENDHAWAQLQKSAKTAIYRKPPGGHIVHNKFLIYVDAKGPCAVLTGSTNWTSTGLCAQTNNVLVIEDRDVATRYMGYWQQLQKDEAAHENKKSPQPFQGSDLRTWDKSEKQFELDNQSTKTDPAAPSHLSSYFSPNTAKQRSKNKKAEIEPIDMNDLETRIMKAEHAVLFLAFIPGTPSIVNFASKAQTADEKLFVRGCLTSPDAAGVFYYALRGTDPPKRVRVPKGQPKKAKVPVKQDPRVIAAQALDPKTAPKGWLPELLKAGFAITHDKIVVIDPFADNCAVVTGSHNLGYQASYNNDENLVIVEGNKKLATAYATHILDVYDHFSWRWAQKRGAPSDGYLKSTPDEWLDRYFDQSGNIKTAQLKFWMQATV